MLRRRTLLGTIGAAGVISLAGCSTSQDDNSGTDTDEKSSAAAVVEEYYTAAAEGDLEGAASNLAMTQLEGGDGRSVEQMATGLRERGLSKSGTDVSLGEFTEISLSEFAEFAFEGEDGEQRQLTEQDVSELVPNASAFGGDEEPVTLVHHTGGFLPEIWVPYQPTEAPADGWGQVIIEVGSYDGDLFVIGDFRTFTDLRVVES